MLSAPLFAARTPPRLMFTPLIEKKIALICAEIPRALLRLFEFFFYA
jgi:hypothetical protein